MTEVEYRKKHVEKWNMIISKFNSGKIEDLVMLENDIMNKMGFSDLENDSFVCDYVSKNCSEIGFNDDDCLDYCPIAEKCGVCHEDGSYYRQLMVAVTNQDRAEAVRLAETIRDAWRLDGKE